MERAVQDRLREFGGAFKGKSAGTGGCRFSPGEPSGLLEFDSSTMNYKLNADGKALLQPIFDRFNYDVSAVRVHFNPDAAMFGQGGITFGDLVVLNRDAWASYDQADRVELLAHEMTHSVQYRDLGNVVFASRYAKETITKGDARYGVPDALAKQMTRGQFLGNATQSGYSLDGLADTIGREATWRLRAQ